MLKLISQSCVSGLGASACDVIQLKYIATLIKFRATKGEGLMDCADQERCQIDTPDKFITCVEDDCHHCTDCFKFTQTEQPEELAGRKAAAFDWFVIEMMDEELEILMEKGGYKTPLEAIEKAMIEQTKDGE